MSSEAQDRSSGHETTILAPPRVETALGGDNLSHGATASDGSVDLSNIKLPYVIKNAVLMAPGKWNGYEFTRESIRRSFRMNDWEDPETKTLFWDHEDNKAKNVIGQTRNVVLTGGDELRGDIYLVNADAARLHAFGQRMGLSLRVRMRLDTNDPYVVQDFVVRNNSVVFNPGVKLAYLNNSQDPNVISDVVFEDIQARTEEKNMNQNPSPPAQPAPVVSAQPDIKALLKEAVSESIAPIAARLEKIESRPPAPAGPEGRASESYRSEERTLDSADLEKAGRATQRTPGAVPSPDARALKKAIEALPRDQKYDIIVRGANHALRHNLPFSGKKEPTR
jgi:hypothetical protein